MDILEVGSIMKSVQEVEIKVGVQDVCSKSSVEVATNVKNSVQHS